MSHDIRYSSNATDRVYMQIFSIHEKKCLLVNSKRVQQHSTYIHQLTDEWKLLKSQLCVCRVYSNIYGFNVRHIIINYKLLDAEQTRDSAELCVFCL